MIRTEDGLFNAAKTGDLVTIQACLAAGLDINSLDGSCTALCYAAENNHLELVQWLVRIGADMNLEIADTREDAEISYSPLCEAIAKGHLGIVRWLIEHGQASVNSPSWGTVLHCAAYHNQTAVIQYLMMVPGVDLWARDSQGRTALDWALITGSVGARTFLEDAKSKLQFLHFALGRHKRIGEHSPVRMLVDDVVGIIHHHVKHSP